MRDWNHMRDITHLYPIPVVIYNPRPINEFNNWLAKSTKLSNH